MSDLQATYCPMLLSRETLPRSQMSSAVLCEHQAQDQAAKDPTTTATGTDRQETYRFDVYNGPISTIIFCQ